MNKCEQLVKHKVHPVTINLCNKKKVSRCLLFNQPDPKYKISHERFQSADPIMSQVFTMQCATMRCLEHDN